MIIGEPLLAPFVLTQDLSLIEESFRQGTESCLARSSIDCSFNTGIQSALDTGRAIGEVILTRGSETDRRVLVKNTM